MRSFGAVLLLVGILGFFYCTSRLSEAPALPEGLTVRESLDHPAGRWELARYGCLGAGALGLLLAMFPRGR